MTIYKKLITVQNELKAPKSQYNSFGKYNYRNQEDILEAVKPLLLKHGLTMFLQDEMEYIGDRYYIKSSVTVIDIETGEQVQNTAMARESLEKKGMDASQITGTASSYARKYALNGMFLIDDTKDADTDEYKQSSAPKNTMQPIQPVQQQNEQKKPTSTEELLQYFAEKSKKSYDETLKAVFKHLGITKSNVRYLSKDEHQKITEFINTTLLKQL